MTYYTFQDFEQADDKKNFILDAIIAHKSSVGYRHALIADAYDKQQNTEIMGHQNVLYTLTGKAVPDLVSANNKIASNFFNQFITQETQYLLGNGVFFEDENIIKILGKRFKTDLQKLARLALKHGVSFGYWTIDRLVAFELTEFVPLFDETTSTLRAGIRFWQIDDEKPLYVTLYEEDGITDYKGDWSGVEPQCEKYGYKLTIQKSKASGEEIVGQEIYSSLPIKVMWGNPLHISELNGIKPEIDAYDRIVSGFANDFDDNAMIYWILENTGGMDDIDLVKFRERVKLTGVAVVDDEETKVSNYTQEIPYQARQAYIEKLEDDIYRDFGALNVDQLSAGNVTATQINASYQRLDDKVSQFEYEVIEFIQNILELMGIEATPRFKRSRITNELEEVQKIMLVASYLDDETILRMLPFIPDERVEQILKAKDEAEINRYEEEPEEPEELEVE